MRAVCSALVAALLALVAVPRPVPANGAIADFGPGCAPDRPAIAHHPGAPALTPQPAGAPMPCGVLTGFGGKEVRIAVNQSGAVFFNPAVKDPGPTDCAVRCLQAGLAISEDSGATWSFSESPTGSRIDNALYADPDTNRVFWIPFSVAAPTLTVRRSDDDGATWRDASACCGSAENPRVVAARPRTSTPSGYAKVVYLCSNSSYLGGLEPAAGMRVCSKSLDGGSTFTLVGPLFSKPVPQHRECLPRGEVFGAVDAHYPQPAPDGTLYVLVRCGGAAPAAGDAEYLAKSTDEGATWPIHHPVPQPPTSAGDLDQLRVDTAANLYLLRTDPASFRPLMRISTDDGATWGPEMDLAAPGVEVGHPAAEAEGVFISPQLWEVAVGEPGHVAVGYYARPPGQSRWDGYLTVTWNALDPLPLLWSGRLNPDDVDLTDAVTDTIGNDFMGTTIAPDGTAWAGFYHAIGVAGRLVPHRQSTGASPRDTLPTRPPAGDVLAPTGGFGVPPVAVVVAFAVVLYLNRWREHARPRARRQSGQ